MKRRDIKLDRITYLFISRILTGGYRWSSAGEFHNQIQQQ